MKLTFSRVKLKIRPNTDMWTGLTLRPFNADWAEHLNFNSMHMMDGRLKMTLEYQFVVLFFLPPSKRPFIKQALTVSVSVPLRFWMNCIKP